MTNKETEGNNSVAHPSDSKANDTSKSVQASDFVFYVNQQDSTFTIMYLSTWEESQLPAASTPDELRDLLPEGFSESSESMFQFDGETDAGRQKLLAHGFIEVDNPTTGSAYYFQRHNTDDYEDFYVVPKYWYDKQESWGRGDLSHEPHIYNALPDGFHEEADYTFAYDGDYEEGYQKLLAAGFIEKAIA